MKSKLGQKVYILTYTEIKEIELKIDAIESVQKERVHQFETCPGSTIVFIQEAQVVYWIYLLHGLQDCTFGLTFII